MPISNDDLWKKARLFVTRARERRDAGVFDEFQLWAALSLELLAKAALASKSPALIVDPKHFDSLLISLGLSQNLDCRTITNRELFDRCLRLVSGFDATQRDYCLQMSEFRNAELHSGAKPFLSRTSHDWQSKYWETIEVLLRFQGRSLEDLVGKDEAKSIARIVADASLALAESVKLRIAKHRKEFEGLLPGVNRKELDKISLITVDRKLEGSDTYHSCPSCQSHGLLHGHTTDEAADWSIESDGWEIPFIRYCESDSFRCYICNLVLSGAAELREADLPLEFEVSFVRFRDEIDEMDDFPR